MPSACLPVSLQVKTHETCMGCDPFKAPFVLVPIFCFLSKKQKKWSLSNCNHKIFSLYKVMVLIDLMFNILFLKKKNHH